MANQRKSKRRQLFFDLEVTERRTRRKLGHVVDITAEGMLLLSSHTYEKGEKLEVVVKLPDLPELHAERLAGTAVVRWSGQDHNPSLSCAGLQFEGLDAKAQAVVDILVVRFGVNKP